MADTQPFRGVPSQFPLSMKACMQEGEKAGKCLDQDRVGALGIDADAFEHALFGSRPKFSCSVEYICTGLLHSCPKPHFQLYTCAPTPAVQGASMDVPRMCQKQQQTPVHIRPARSEHQGMHGCKPPRATVLVQLHLCSLFHGSR
eukprot:1145861-Pelagomonas_calceolata.AAC.11